MQHLGAVKTLKEAIAQGKVIAERENATFVYEKAKCKVGKTGRLQVCYRGWLDRDIKGGLVVSIKEWDKMTGRPTSREEWKKIGGLEGWEKSRRR